ncbi:Trafficking protein particle complex subunit [Lachancea thermotolerans]|uniref:Trafficking protein particle complex subunit n=1 Tax=Lachancea thermotolerans (strain ATCC 56472 / CBS 6340 / NRRL Y-8284) TaxID=559295 RepID=C5DIA9_LACTC|nr:KLTH0E11066p [Lachancea thermotolerans CBS 6340]CAR23520.1 KLTH0E11066p [Lachancea thermotolerans CBS 6340]
MAIQTILVINKSGGLVYQRDFIKTGAKLSSNEYLILAGTLQGVVAIASQVTPKALQISAKTGSKTANEPSQLIPYVGSLGAPAQNLSDMGSFMGQDFFNESFPSWNQSGLKHVTTDQLSMFLYQTLTGLKFVAISTQSTTNAMAVSIAENLLRKAYCLYADYVMKNPFHDPEMPIKCELFDTHLAELVGQL